ncbi:CynX/NimT family MFS transporter [Bradyrhizobium sp. CSS354]|uniref:MFS transporter n=1 Tax=Bradyrhizobium sp. CSS354 TaxID=2699172 RepID=UPI0023B19B63|nr:MFS transporter [Bradyrhizobium sp. CSS354]MDE5462122.1 MFS transporter [Bradyrhizobium sp. CSS354]
MPDRRWLILLVLFLARTALAIQFQAVASAGPFLIAALVIDYAALGLLIGLHSLPGVAIAIPGGVLGQNLGAKRVALTGLFLMAVGGTVMGFGQSFLLAAVGRTVLGGGAVLFNVLATKMVADWFSGREIATAMGTLVSSWPLGIALGLLVFGSLGAEHGWAAIMHASTMCVLAGFVLVALFYQEPPGVTSSSRMRLKLDLNRREWTLVCIAGAIWALFNVAYIVVVSFGPELFGRHGFSLVQANLVVSLIGWTLIPAIPLASAFVERFGRPDLAMLASFTVTGVGLLVVPFASGVGLLAAFALIVLGMGVPPGLIMALPAQALRPEARAGGMGVYYTWYYAAMAILPTGAGLARDYAGSAAAPMVFAAAMLILCVLALILFQAAQGSSEQ